MQPELLKMQNLSIEELLAIANAKVEPSQHQRHTELLEKNKEGSLTSEERQELTNLRLAADRLMLRKAYACSVLRWRGHRIPPLKELFCRAVSISEKLRPQVIVAADYCSEYRKTYSVRTRKRKLLLSFKTNQA